MVAMKEIHDTVRAVNWVDGDLVLLDQRRLPAEEAWLMPSDVAAVADAIRDMVVRGAPAIGITAAYGAVIAARRRYRADTQAWREGLQADLDLLRQARPTAVNLGWALDRVEECLKSVQGDPQEPLLALARGIHEQDIAANRRMGELGAGLIGPGSGVLTHCNTGSLATGGYGTALGVIRSAWAQGKLTQVFADETRPWLQGARLTAWELVRDGIPVSLAVDGAAAHLMKTGRVQWLIVGSDRIAANGDVANKIGTCTAAVVAHYYGVKVMVVAPASTVDMHTAEGADIPIENRPAGEVLELAGRRVAAAGAGAWNPAFDVTPAVLVDVIVTERGIVEHPDAAKMAALMT
jgi:methylthioribose-1-phosphate isomerase